MSIRCARRPRSLSRSGPVCAATVLSLTMLVSACAGSDGQATGPGVATLPTGASVASDTAAPDGTGASTVAAPAKKGPQIRPDTTEAEKTQWMRVYGNCLGNAGVTMEAGKPGSFPYPAEGAREKPSWAKAERACAAKKPIPPPAEDPATNPHYLDDYRKEIRCLNAGGLKVDPLPKGGGWNFSEDYREGELSPAQEARLMKKCEIEAYSGG